MEKTLEAGRAGPIRRPLLGGKQWSPAMGPVSGGGRNLGQSSEGGFVGGLNGSSGDSAPALRAVA